MASDYRRSWTPTTPKKSQMLCRLFKKEVHSFLESLKVVIGPGIQTAETDFIFFFLCNMGKRADVITAVRPAIPEASHVRSLSLGDEEGD